MNKIEELYINSYVNKVAAAGDGLLVAGLAAAPTILNSGIRALAANHNRAPKDKDYMGEAGKGATVGTLGTLLGVGGAAASKALYENRVNNIDDNIAFLRKKLEAKKDIINNNSPWPSAKKGAKLKAIDFKLENTLPAIKERLTKKAINKYSLAAIASGALGLGLPLAYSIAPLFNKKEKSFKDKVKDLFK